MATNINYNWASGWAGGWPSMCHENEPLNVAEHTPMNELKFNLMNKYSWLARTESGFVMGEVCDIGKGHCVCAR